MYIYSILFKLKFKKNLKSEKIEWWQQRREMEMDRWCRDIDYGACVPRYVHAHVYTQNAFRYLRQSDSYWYLEEEHRRTINLDDRRLRGLRFVRVGGSGKGTSPIRMQDASAFKVVVRLPDIPLRNHVMRDFYCFLPSLSFRINDVSIFR